MDVNILYDKIKYYFIENYDRFLPRIYPKEAVRRIIDISIYNMPFYIIDSSLAVQYLITEDDRIIVPLLLKISEDSNFHLINKMLYLSCDIISKTKNVCDFTFSFYDRNSSFHEKISNEVEEGYVLSAISPNIEKYLDDALYVPSTHIFQTNYFLASVDFNLIKSDPIDNIFQGLKLKRCVDVYSNDIFPLLQLKEEIEKYKIKTDIRKIYNYNTSCNNRNVKKLVERGKNLYSSIYFLLNKEITSIC